MEALDEILTFDSPKAKVLKVLIWPIVYWATLVILTLTVEPGVDAVTLGYSTFA